MGEKFLYLVTLVGWLYLGNQGFFQYFHTFGRSKNVKKLFLET
jgi:hypothetical protein